MLKKLARNVLETILRPFRYELRPIESPPIGFTNFLKKTAPLFSTPNTVFDIGVGRGTPWLYSAFPDAHLVLVEPLPYFSSYLDQIKQSRPCSVFRCALGRNKGRSELLVPYGCPTGASIKSSENFVKDGYSANSFYQDSEKVDIELSTLDEINRFDPPFFLKIDTEGSELDILYAGVNLLRSTNIVILEISITNRYRDEGSFCDIIKFMNGNGFSFIDIITMNYRQGYPFLCYIDVAFARTEPIRDVK